MINEQDSDATTREETAADPIGDGVAGVQRVGTDEANVIDTAGGIVRFPARHFGRDDLTQDAAA